MGCASGKSQEESKPDKVGEKPIT